MLQLRDSPAHFAVKVLDLKLLGLDKFQKYLF